MKPKTVLVTGSHTQGFLHSVWHVLDEQHKLEQFERLVAGGADFVDTFAAQWAQDRKVPYAVEFANWRLYGNYAGPTRNRRMLALYKPYLVLAFPGFESRGTRDMMAAAREELIEVREFQL
jgi:hypothetical protein